MTAEVARRAFSVDEYHRMVVAGVLGENDHVELLDGEVRQMSLIGPYHAAVVKRLMVLVNRQLPHTLLLSVQDPIQLPPYNEPQPDIAVLYARDDFYAAAHPTPEDVLLVVEVADTSASYDRNEKLPRYAQAAISEVWIVDLNALVIEQYTRPVMGQYRTKQPWEQGQTVEATSVPLQLAVDQVLGV